MGIGMLLITALALAMDACAVSVCHGLQFRRVGSREMLQFGLFFGIFQGAMTAIGFLAGQVFARFIQRWDHWIALVLLTVVGGKMLWELREMKDEIGTGDIPQPTLTAVPFKVMVMLALATSLDALAVGVSFSVIQVNLIAAVLCIAGVAGVLSALGVRLGKLLGHLFERRAQLVGGLVLIAIGIKICIEHLMKGI